MQPRKVPEMKMNKMKAILWIYSYFFVKDCRAAIFDITKEARNNSSDSNLTLVDNSKPPIKPSEEDTSFGWSGNSNKVFERSSCRFIEALFLSNQLS